MAREHRPRTRFYDNLDPRTLEARARRASTSAAARFIRHLQASGGTPETLVQAHRRARSLSSAAGLRAPHRPELFLGLTEPAAARHRPNGLRDAVSRRTPSRRLPIIDPGIGGRYLGASPTSACCRRLRAASTRVAVRAGAETIVQSLLNAKAAGDFVLPAIGASIAIGLAKEKGIKANVMMPYSDRLSRFAAWYVQLWGESLGKSGKGTTPVACLGPSISTASCSCSWTARRTISSPSIRATEAAAGPKVIPPNSRSCGCTYLGDRTAGDLVAAQSRAIPEALLAAGRPVRTIDSTGSTSGLGALFMHFMLETILAGQLLGVDPFDQPAVE